MNYTIDTSTPITTDHEGITVIRDDLYPGGTKARYCSYFFRDVEEVVYASPCEGGAQTAIAYTAKKLRKKATIVVAERKDQHSRVLLSQELGANIIQVRPGYLATVKARAKEYTNSKDGKVLNVDFGLKDDIALETIAATANQLEEPDEIWFATGSGVLARGITKAWPKAIRIAIAVGRQVTPEEVSFSDVIVYKQPFSAECKFKPDFPSDLHYDAKAWYLCKKYALRGNGRKVYFWNVAGDPKQQSELISELK